MLSASSPRPADRPQPRKQVGRSGVTCELRAGGGASEGRAGPWGGASAGSSREPGAGPREGSGLRAGPWGRGRGASRIRRTGWPEEQSPQGPRRRAAAAPSPQPARVRSMSFVPVPEGCDFPIHNLPYGVFSTAGHVSCRASAGGGGALLLRDPVLRDPLRPHHTPPRTPSPGRTLRRDPRTGRPGCEAGGAELPASSLNFNSFNPFCGPAETLCAEKTAFT